MMKKLSNKSGYFLKTIVFTAVIFIMAFSAAAENVNISTNFSGGSWWPSLNIEITNTGTNAIKDWEVQFDFQHNISYFSSAQIKSHSSEHYTLCNNSWDNPINPGQTLIISGGFSGGAQMPSDTELPTSFKFNGTAIGGENSPPQINITSPINGSVIEQETLSPINISAIASDSDGTVENVKIEVDGKTFTGTDASWTPSAFGTYTISATATDNEGATASATSSVTIKEQTVIVNDPPQVSITSPLNGSTVELDSLSSINISAAASDSDGTVESVIIDVDGQTFSGTTASWTPSEFGTYAITATATDNDGTTASAVITVIVKKKDTSASATVKGWPNYISMGAVTRGIESHHDGRPVDAVFKYAGDGGNGDRGSIKYPIYTKNIGPMVKSLSTKYGKNVTPVMVVYTAEMSGGTNFEDLHDFDNLTKHFINLMHTAQILQSFKSAENPYPGSIVLNADLLGMVQQQNLWAQIDAQPIKVQEALYKAYHFMNDKYEYNGQDLTPTEIFAEMRKGAWSDWDVKLTWEQYVENNIFPILSEDAVSAIPSFDNDFKGWIQATNWTIKNSSPDVSFGWQENIWSGNSANWVHNNYTENEIDQLVAGPTSTLWNDLEVYSGEYKPDFLVFDKYERDGTSAAGIGYFFNARDWDNYLTYVKLISKDLGNVPVMLWQIPGGHLQTVGGIDTREDHGSSAPNYFFGDDELMPDLNNVKPYILDIPLTSVYNSSSPTIGEYLLENNYDWTNTGNMQKAKDSNVFSILWGGGDTTSVGLFPFDDGGWLSNKVNEYYLNPTYLNGSTPGDPVAEDDNFTAEKDRTTTLSVLANDIGSQLSIQSVTVPDHGIAEITGTQISYTPETNFVGNDTFTYTVTDSESATATAAVNVNVIEPPPPPVPTVENDTATTIVDSSVTIDVLINDTGDTISIDSVTAPANGTAVIEDGKIKYAPNSGFEGNDTFNYTIVDEHGQTASGIVTIAVKTQSSTNKVVVGYWHNFNNGSSVMPLRDVPNEYNVVDIAFAEPTSFTDMTMKFSVDSSIQTESSFKADVAALQAEGRKVLISIGGANGHIRLNTAADRDKFASSMIQIVEDYNFDGIDIDFEGGAFSIENSSSFKNPTSPLLVNAIEATKTIINHFKAQGKNFWLTAAPETYYLQTGISAYGGTAGSYIPFLYALKDDLNFVAPQLYNSGSMVGLDGKAYSVGTPDFTVAMTELLTNGFTVAGTGEIFKLRSDQVVVGLPSTTQAAGSGYMNTANTLKALDYLTKATSFGGNYHLTNSAGYPDLRGIMTWSVNWDNTNSYEFANTFYDYFNSSEPTPNNPPVANDDSAETDINTSVSINVLSNDNDPNGDSIAISSVSTPQNGTITNTPSIIEYTPSNNFEGTDSFNYTISDGQGGSDTATVTVNVNNDPVVLNYTITASVQSSINDGESYPEYVQPTGGHDTYSKGDKVTFNGSAYESLIDYNSWSPTVYPAGWKSIPDGSGGSTTYSGTISPSGEVTVEKGETQTFTIAPDSGSKVKDVKVDGSSVGQVTSYNFTNVNSNHIIVAEFEEGQQPVNIKPSVSFRYLIDGQVIKQKTLSNINIEINSADEDGTIASENIKIEGQVHSGNIYNWTPSGFGTFAITATATDNSGDVSEKTINVTIEKQEGNTSPTVSFGEPTNYYTITQETLSPVSIQINAEDIDGSIASVLIEVDGQTFTETPAEWTPSNFADYQISVTVTDNEGATAFAAITVTIQQGSIPVSANKQVVGYITQWDAWKGTSFGYPAQGVCNQLNVDYSKYTILNFSFFGLAKDGSLHSGDYRNKQMSANNREADQEPADLLHSDPYSSWDYWILYGDLELIQWVGETDTALQQRLADNGFTVEGTTWTNSITGLSGSFPVPLPKENGDPGLIKLCKQNNVKLMASLGGWSMSKHFSEMAADSVKKAKFLADCKTLIDMGFDGIDIDWEYPGAEGMNFTGTQADYHNFTLLMKDIRETIGEDKLITAAFSAAPAKLADFEWSELDKYMNYYNMMTYDLGGGWSSVTEHNSPLYGAASWDNTFKYLTQTLNVKSDKINMGVAFYGRGVETGGTADLGVATNKTQKTFSVDGTLQSAADFTNWLLFEGAPNYSYIVDNSIDWEYHWDSAAQVPYKINGNAFLSYDNEQSVELKAQYVNDNDAGGVIIWQIFGDWDFSNATAQGGTKLKKYSNVKTPLLDVLNNTFKN